MSTDTVIGHSYTPRGASRELFSCKEGEVCLVGPAGTGKSLSCLEKLNLQAIKYAGMKGLIVRKTQVSLTSSALVTWRKFVIPELVQGGYVTFYGGGPEEPAQYRYANGSKINIGGMDKSSKIMSTEYDVVYVQEATELLEDDWEAITTRLRNWVMPYQQIIADCNPSFPTHWLNLRGRSGKTKFLVSRHEDNPALFDDAGNITVPGREYMSKLDSLTGVRYLRLRKGIWAAAEGVIYDRWDDQANIINPFPVPKEWPRYWSVDFGFTNPFVLQMWAQDPDGRLYLYREIYRTQRLVEDHARAVLNIVRPNGTWLEPQPVAVICDHDAEDRATLERHLGRATVPAKKTVSDGLQAVQARIPKAGDGKPRIFIMRGCTVDRDASLTDRKLPSSTEEEIPGYIWAPVPEGKALKDEPLKKDDHGVDALRYIVAQIDLVGRPRIRSFRA